MKTFIKYLLSFVMSISIIFIMLISSVQIAVYGDIDGYFKNEYTKYNVLDEVSMTMDDIMYVTHEMMDYLDGKRDDLVVNTTVNGVEREFFSTREKLHIEDVKNLFVGGKNIRFICIFIAVISGLILVFICKEYKKVMAKGFLFTSAFIAVISAVVSLIVSTNFTKYFVIFHNIFFNNDLWLLDPKVDLLINIVPEPFFIDTALRILILFGIMAVIGIAISVIILFVDSRRRIV